MSTTKRMLEEIEKVQDVLIDFLDFFKNSNISESKKNQSIQILNHLLNNVEKERTRQKIIDVLIPYQDFLKQKGTKNEQDLYFLSAILSNFDNKANISTTNDNSINSEQYYNRKIRELELRESELKNTLNKNKYETEEQRKIALETKEKLINIENELSKKKKELELKEKQDDAKNDWEQKINETFKNLKEYLKPIQREHNRLNILYYVYAGLCIITLILIVISEINLILKISQNESLPNLNEYILILLPIPIAGALMWGFIFQMNRAQRQLIAISNNIHSVNYIQGLLLSINNLSLDINDGITRVNNALDKIISNHLNRRLITNEKDIKNEEEKDSLEFDKVLQIISTIKK